jgi:hypothetical protein
MKRVQPYVQVLSALAAGCLLFVSAAAIDPAAAGVDCSHGACTTPGLMPTLQLETHRHRKLQQGWGGGFAGCEGLLGQVTATAAYPLLVGSQSQLRCI